MKAYQELLRKCKDSEFETTQTVFLKKPIIVGYDAGSMPIYCNYISTNFDGRLTLHVLHTYSIDGHYDFSYITYNNGDVYDDSFPFTYIILNRVFELVNEALTDEWVCEQLELQKIQRNLTRKLVRKSLTWEEKKELYRVNVFFDKNKLESDSMYEEKYKEMLELGQEAYESKEAEYNKRMMDILNDL